MGRIHGITISLEVVTETESSPDSFGVPVYASTWVDVGDVIVGQPTDTERTNSMNLYGERAVYTLGIPKGDAHTWRSGLHVKFFGETFRIIGHTVKGIDDMVPLEWNKKVMVASDV